ncbi:MerR family transcriptional regulator [Oscillibacter sp.]|uniref:MerR family transcriptional regulator n=1 Tax=Oscillibacter sp. TaxID=1945593 RepID=UPI002D807958|nr:MerR family transcriptional regulator [Oscillibacter sp.]
MTIGEMSRRTGLPESTLRYYEKKGLLRVSRDGGGRRDYGEDDVAWVQFLRRLKETGMPLKDIRRYSELRYAGEGTMPERLEMLRAHREYVLNQRRRWDEYLENLDEKIGIYEHSIEGRSGPA